jgi:hypothetical protein
VDVPPDQTSGSKTSNVSFSLHDPSDSATANEDESEAVAGKKSPDDVFESSQTKPHAEEMTEEGIESKADAYLCIKVNKNREFMYCPLDRKMKNKLTSEFWFQINDHRYVVKNVNKLSRIQK